MTRIASSMINSNALTDLQRAQRELFDAQRKTATQREAEDLKGYGSDARTVVSLDRMRAQAEAYKASAEELTTRLDLQDAHIGRAADVVGTLREKLTNALALGDLSSVGSDISAAFSDLKSSFNATLNGKYMFGGNLPTEAPIVTDSISDLANNPLADAVNSDASAVQVRIDKSRLVDEAPLAHEISQESLTILRDLQIFAESVDGPFSENPTQAQQDAIKSALSQMKSVYEGLIEAQGKNGRVLNETDAAIERHTSERDLLESLSANITDVDLAEVAVQLNQAQLQYQATASVFNTIQDLSLVNLLR
ncbi:flagellin [Ponticaulis koreensis]|uniref:flagellin n=1 Tax=Ponticaulis koreensis TaxID=1123045 RepID=UPI0003B43266|nr:flagellin [Ponticaulis koreensis]